MKRILVLLLLTFTLSAATAGAEDQPATITVRGQVTLTTEADRATLHLDLRHLQAEPNTSYALLRDDLNSLVKDLQAAGIAEKQLTISAITQGPEYVWENNKKIIKGYLASCTLRVVIEDLSSLHQLYGSLARYPAVSFGQAEYTSSSLEQLQRQVLQQALQQAKTKALALAETAGASLGSPLLIEELGGGPMVMAEPVMAARMADQPFPVSVGSVLVTGELLVKYGLQP